VWDLTCYQHRRFVDQTASEADNFPPLGTNPFQQGSKVSEISEDMFNMDLGPFQPVAMLPNSMASARPILIFPFIRRGSGQSINITSRGVQADGIVWDPFWGV
jgi:hypothetical protein